MGVKKVMRMNVGEIELFTIKYQCRLTPRIHVNPYLLASLMNAFTLYDTILVLLQVHFPTTYTSISCQCEKGYENDCGADGAIHYQVST